MPEYPPVYRGIFFCGVENLSHKKLALIVKPIVCYGYKTNRCQIGPRDPPTFPCPEVKSL